MEHRIKRGAKGYAEPVKGKPGTFRLYFSLGKNPVTGKYDRTPKRTHHCRSKNPRNWPKECENALAAYRAELEGASRDDRQVRTVGEYANDFHSLRESEFKSPLSSQREAVYVRHITDMLGEIRLDDLRPEDIRRAYAEARRRGCPNPSCTAPTSSSARITPGRRPERSHRQEPVRRHQAPQADPQGARAPERGGGVPLPDVPPGGGLLPQRGGDHDHPPDRHAPRRDARAHLGRLRPRQSDGQHLQAVHQRQVTPAP